MAPRKAQRSLISWKHGGDGAGDRAVLWGFRGYDSIGDVLPGRFPGRHKPADVPVTANVAARGGSGRDRQAGLNAVGDDLLHLRMEAKRSRHQPFGVWMPVGSGSNECGDVVLPVLSWREEIGKHDDTCGPLQDTAIICRGDIGLGNFHVGRLHDSVA